MFRSLFALTFVLAVTALPVQAQPRQPLPIRFVQGSSGALFLTQEMSAWPLVPDQISDDDLAALTPRGRTNVLPVDPLFRPEPRQQVVQGSDGTLYDIIDGDANTDGVWPLVPDQISDTDLAGLSLGSEIDGTIPPGLATGALADTAPATAAPVGSLPTQTTSQQQSPVATQPTPPASTTAQADWLALCANDSSWQGIPNLKTVEVGEPISSMIILDELRDSGVGRFPNNFRVTLPGRTWHRVSLKLSQPLAGGLRLQFAGPQGTSCRSSILAAARVPVPQLADKLLSEYSFESILPGPVLISVDLAYTARVAVAYTFKVDMDTDPPRQARTGARGERSQP